MTTFEQAEAVKRILWSLPEFARPEVNGVGITKHEDEFAVVVYFIGDLPEGLPDRVMDVKVVYESNVGEIVPL